MGIDYPANTNTSPIPLLNSTYSPQLDLFRVKLEFPGFDQDIMIESNMYYESMKNKVLFVTQISVDYTGVSKSISYANKIITFQFNNTNSLLKQWVESKIEKNNFTTAINQLKAQLDAITSRLERMSNPGLSREDRKLEIVPALHNLETMLNLFKNRNDFYYKNPLIMAPSLIAIAQVYIETASIAPSVIPSYKDDLKDKMATLKQTLRDYKDNFIRERTEKIDFGKVRLVGSDFYTVKDHFVRRQQTIRHYGWMLYTGPLMLVAGPLLYDPVRSVATDFSPEAIKIGEEYKEKVIKTYTDYFDTTITRLR